MKKKGKITAVEELAQMKRSRLRYQAKLGIFKDNVLDLCNKYNIQLPVPQEGYIEALFKNKAALFKDIKTEEELAERIRSWVQDCG